MTTHQKIEEVLSQARRPLAKHEFREFVVTIEEDGERTLIPSLKWIGCSEETLGRRLRELKADGRVRATKRSGKTFVEYVNVFSIPAVHTTVCNAEPPCPI